MPVTASNQLAAIISKLQTERQRHLDAVAQIDATFEQFGIATTPAKKRPGRPRKNTKTAKPDEAAKLAAKKAKKGKRKARGTFKVSGLNSILGFVKQATKSGRTTSEIVKHWKSEGRSGDGYTTLSQLVGAKKLKKEKIEGAKGSRYTAV